MKKYILSIILLAVAGWGTKVQTFSDDNFVYTVKPKIAVLSTKLIYTDQRRNDPECNLF